MRRVGTGDMNIQIPDRLLPLFRELARRHLVDMRAQLHLMGAGHPQASRAAEVLQDAHELARAAGVPEPKAE